MEPFSIVILLLLLSAVFSSSEIAIMWVPLYKIKKHLNEHPENSKSQRLFWLREHGDRTLIAILIGNNLVNVALSIYASQLGDSILSWFAYTGALAFIIISVVVTFLILFFGEIIPKVFATKYALRFALTMTWPIYGVIMLLYPFVWILETVIKLFHKILWTQQELVSRDDIEIFVNEWKQQEIFSQTEALIIHNFLEFRDRSVDSIFQHRTNVFALDELTTLDAAITQVLQNPYTRIPIYQWDKDHIVGIITLRDLLRLYKEADNHLQSLKSFGFKQTNKVPITAKIYDTFLDMKKYGWHFAVVIDEYGGTAGIVTFEDILEDLVWDIRDESDHREEGEIIKVDEHTVVVKWEVPLRDVIDMLQLEWWKIPNDLEVSVSEEESVAYILLAHLKDFAKQWDCIRIWDLHLEVTKVNKYGDTIKKVKITVLDVIEEGLE